jgi:hypothetical protein
MLDMTTVRLAKIIADERIQTYQQRRVVQFSKSLKKAAT